MLSLGLGGIKGRRQSPRFGDAMEAAEIVCFHQNSQSFFFFDEASSHFASVTTFLLRGCIC